MFERIGRDHALTLDELTRDAASDIGGASAAWDVLGSMWAAYERHWRRFCGSRLDPQFHRFDHPARQTGAVQVTDGAPVVVVGTGPSLRRAAADLRRVRAGVQLVTSPRGADALAEFGLIPDLVLVEHQTPVDAQFSVQDRWHQDRHAITRVPWVAASPATPSALLQGIPQERLFVPAPWPTWGLWPATAVALGLGSGARAVALVGVDLGTLEWPDPSQRSLRSLLELLAAHAGVPCVDVGPGGSCKVGWDVDTLDALTTWGAAAPLQVTTTPWSHALDPYPIVEQLVASLEALAGHAEATFGLACQVRDGDRSAPAIARLTEQWEGLMQAGACLENRVDLQDGLGASFLPRFWRIPPAQGIGARLWRPAALAAHEIVAQYRALQQQQRQIGARR